MDSINHWNIRGEEVYKREDSNLVQDALIRLGVDTSDTSQEVYKQYAGPFWEDYVPFELPNAVLVLDTVTDKVYIVNFEGGDELLLKGELKETWSSFFDFIQRGNHT
ncbi:MAG: hypothetical protein ACE3JR_05815 [Ectobacillus sp.]